MKCIDNSFFEEYGGREASSSTLVSRHGVYAYSSKDWNKIK
jgi:hypothetical protein